MSFIFFFHTTWKSSNQFPQLRGEHESWFCGFDVILQYFVQVIMDHNVCFHELPIESLTIWVSIFLFSQWFFRISFKLIFMCFLFWWVFLLYLYFKKSYNYINGVLVSLMSSIFYDNRLNLFQFFPITDISSAVLHGIFKQISWNRLEYLLRLLHNKNVWKIWEIMLFGSPSKFEISLNWQYSQLNICHY